MANTQIFNSIWGTKNEAGGTATEMAPKLALAQLATTGCLSNTLYTTAENQLDKILGLANRVSAEYLAKVAIHSREKYFMKDVPAMLVAVLATRKDHNLLPSVFPRVINNGDMLRNFFQIIRSGKVGRKSFGTLPKRLLTEWFNCRTPTEIFDQSVGTPSIKDILRCVRPKPLDKTRSATYGWFVDKDYDFEQLPEKIQVFEKYKQGTGEMPHVDFRMLTAQKLSDDQWTEIAKRASWKWMLKNLNNMMRHGVFAKPDMVDFVASKLSDEKEVKKARVFPYQILTTYQNTKDVPETIKKSLEAAMEVATQNVPVLPESKGGESVWVLMDISKSMSFPITGSRYGLHNRATSNTRCVDVASLIASCLLRRNKNSNLLCFNTDVVPVEFDQNKSVMENADAIGKVAVGGTNCSAAMNWLNENQRASDLVVLLSDNQSWCESLNVDRYGRKAKPGKTELQKQWELWKQRNPNSKLVCVDVAPYTTVQVQERTDTLNLGGWSDDLFNVISQFADGSIDPNHIVGIIEKTRIEEDVDSAG